MSKLKLIKNVQKYAKLSPDQWSSVRGAVMSVSFIVQWNGYAQYSTEQL